MSFSLKISAFKSFSETTHSENINVDFGIGGGGGGGGGCEVQCQGGKKTKGIVILQV